MNLRVLHLPVNTAGIPWANVEALRRRGVHAELAVFTRYRLHPEADWTIDRPRGLAGRQLAQLRAFARAAHRTDLFHFYFGLTLLPKSVQFHVLRLLGKRSVMHFLGSDIRGKPPRELDWARRAGARIVGSYDAVRWVPDATVIPPGVDISRFYPIPEDEAKAYIGVPPEDHMLLFVGRIEPLKGLDILLEAIGRYCKERKGDGHPRLFLAVIGGEPEADSESMTAEMARLQALREQYGITDVVTFLGKRSQDTLPYYYSAAEAVVVPSHYESFGMVALEAMACGTPVVASQVGGLAFLVKDGETGYTIPVGDPGALCVRLKALINDPDLRKRMGESAAAFAQEYSWDKITGRIIQLYQDLLTGGDSKFPSREA